MKKYLLFIVMLSVFLTACEGMNLSSKKDDPKDYHTVTYLNEDGSTLLELDVEDGKDAYFESEEPSKTWDDEFAYVFNHWNKNLNDIKEDVSVSPVFRKIKKNSEVYDELTINEEKGIINLSANIKEAKDYIIPSISNDKLLETFNHVVGNNIEYSIHVPNSYRFIDVRAVKENVKAKLYYEGTMDEWASTSKDIYSFVKNGGEIYIDNKLLTNLTLSEGITEIKEGTLSNPAITSYSIPNSIRNIINDPYMYMGINEEAFYIENETYYLGNEVNKYLVNFKGLTRLNNGNIITFNENTTIINLLNVSENDIIYLHDNIRCVIAIGHLQESNGVYFEGDYYDFFNLNLSSSLLQAHVFIENKDISTLESIEIPNNISSLKSHIISHFSSLKTLVIPDNIKTIESNAISGLGNIELLDLGHGVKHIKVTGISFIYSKIIIRKNVEIIEASGFFLCTALMFIEHEAKPEGWDDQWFPIDAGHDQIMLLNKIKWKDSWTFDENGLPVLIEE